MVVGDKKALAVGDGGRDRAVIEGDSSTRSLDLNPKRES